MKWLIVSVLVIPVMAFSKSFYVSLENTPALTESVLEQQRGGFKLPGIDYSIGLRMEALVNGNRVFFSDVFNVANNRLVLPEVSGLPDGMKITPFYNNRSVGYILENSQSGINTNINLEINITTPQQMNAIRNQQQISTRIRSATRNRGY
ncbi:hypothetical protein HNR62_001985 [Oceanisphaera litoralis]|uniref:hypothetical protein n=1 Tax=Oceanisphaera litoralis TaxID=225144 RepID=UPI00195E5060|nr:hypothetical protein [Oceanisphaera litoralis]MBM7456104.1 hypothetical protein [Oceanisphaera litoralis]